MTQMTPKEKRSVVASTDITRLSRALSELKRLAEVSDTLWEAIQLFFDSTSDVELVDFEHGSFLSLVLLAADIQKCVHCLPRFGDN